MEGGGAGASSEGGAANAAAAKKEEVASKRYSEEELRGMPVRQLKGILEARGAGKADVVEKEDLVQVQIPSRYHMEVRIV